MTEKILVLGASGYVGSAFVAELNRRKIQYFTLTRGVCDYTRFDVLWNFLNSVRPTFVINAGGYTGKPNVDSCEVERADTLVGNVAFPLTLANACYAANIPFGHVSSGCVYSGAKLGDGTVVKDLTTPEMKKLVEAEARDSVYGLYPNQLFGFTEMDAPNFSFRNGPSSFYSGTKALSEEVMLPLNMGYLWRLRIPFDENNSPRNYLTKVQTYQKVYNNVNSVSHLGDFVSACLDLWRVRAPFGVYNVVNEGWITTEWVISRIKHILGVNKDFEFWENDEEFYKFAKTPRSNCILDCNKLCHVGIDMRPAVDAIEFALKKWKA